MIKLLVVDDSAFMRMAIAKMVEHDANIQVVGEARDGIQAIKMAERLRPTVITMDVEMPNLGGIEAVKRIMSTTPCPIIMISSLTSQGAEVTFQAIEAGAVDYIAKNSSFVQLDIVKVEKELREKIIYWAARPLKQFPASQKAENTTFTWQHTAKLSKSYKPKIRPQFVVVGVSTGGPRTVLDLLKSIEKPSCPIIIAQHMPKEFTPGFASHLAFETGFDVVEGYHGMILKSDQIVVAPGGLDCQVLEPFSGSYALDIKKFPDTPVHPSADKLFSSVAKVCRSAIAIILTGMGNDGTAGAREFTEKQFPVLVQDPTTCVVEGMPSAAIDADVVSDVLKVDQIGKKINHWCRDNSTPDGYIAERKNY